MPFKFPKIVKALRMSTATAEGIFTGLINLLWTRDFGDRIELKPGDIAPDFSLLDSTGKIVSLHDFKGKKNVALGFYVFAFTGG